MKKVIKITESELMELVRKVISEQDETVGNPDACTKELITYYLTPSDVKSNKVIGGGGLYYWNKNKIPTVNDIDASVRLLMFLEKVIKDKTKFQVCDGLEFADLLSPFNKYYSKIVFDLNRKDTDPVVEFLVNLYRENGLEMPKEMKRRMSEAAVINAIITKMDKFPPTDDYDEFEYADIILGGLVSYLFPNVSEDLFYEIKDFILNEYASIILDHHREIVGPQDY